MSSKPWLTWEKSEIWKKVEKTLEHQNEAVLLLTLTMKFSKCLSHSDARGEIKNFKNTSS
jgi:hypothetical protein